MTDFFSKIGQHNVFWLMVIGGAVIFGVVATIAHAWRRVRIAEIEGALKQQMLDRGMSADEIERVARASNQPSLGIVECGIDGSETQTGIVQNLAENGYSAEDIERILKALPKSSADATQAAKAI
jgi:hypothetical protein